MFLKTLTIKGFKSFADTAELGLEPGVTVVVGPNGSGKSNVVDAIAWVLGAQAPSAVRSQKMDDVIFAGTTKKSALGRAEVSLCIDNSAGLLPIDFSEVTITRTLFRTGESEYAINGVTCRLLDVQDLLSDSGVGRMQHVIISQGQIDSVLNAKPTERRLIIEEAAGILKFRKRKERSERRLSATEANLTRVSDLLREVRRGLRPLERQAEAARRHGDLVTELDALRRHLAGRELVQLRQRLDLVTRQRAEQAGTGEAISARLAQLDTAVLAAESELSAIGGSDVGDDLARFEALRERGRGLTALLAERGRSLGRERAATADAGVIASLESDQARLRAELAEVDAAAEALLPEADEVARAEQGLADARASFEERWGDGVLVSSGEAAAVRAEIVALRTAVQRAAAEAERTDAATAHLRQKVERLAAEAQRLAGEVAAGDAAIPGLEADRDACVAARAGADITLEAADAALAEAVAEHRSWAARADALALALDQARAAAGAERLAGIEGVAGTLLDLVEVEPGWETAFEAAAGDALAVIVVESPEVGREALAALRDGDLTGAVIALGVPRPVPPTPPVGEAIRAHVRSIRPGVDALLDSILGGAVRLAGTWAQGLDAHLAHPAATVVTDDGATFGPGAWRLGGSTTGATGAALAEARAGADAAAETVAAARGARDEARARAAEVRALVGPARLAVDQAVAARRRAADALARVEREAADAARDLTTRSDGRDELDARLEDERRRLAELEAALPALEAEEAAAARTARALAEARAAVDERAAAVAALRSDLEVRAAQVDDRRTFLRQRLAALDARLARNHEAAREAAVRRRELDARAATLDALARGAEATLAAAEERLVVLRAERQAQSEAQRDASARLDGLRRERVAVESQLVECRARHQRAELELREVQLRIETAVETMRRDLDVDPDTAVDTPAPELPEGVNPAARARELDRELRLMGPINPLALEEFEALQERHQLLQSQLEDVKSARRELAKVIKAIDDEIVQVFAAAYADVAENFEQLFSTLFPGGRGRLSLTDPVDLLETGVEVEAKPSGKNVRKLSLLSGGERSLAALAFLFAVFRSRPSPFYVMDEVEAALDDVNLHRFLDLVAEFRREAQLVIVSHQKRTMEAADILYGVTMQPGGSSKVVSERSAARAAGVA